MRNAAAGVQAETKQADAAKIQAAEGQAPLTAGPADKEEVTAPGKIDADAPREFTKTASGLEYRILRKGSDKKPTARDTVVAHYKGWLEDKTVFDSSYRRGEPIPFPLKGVIPGWTEGMQFVGEGGMIELAIPYKLGYGERGTPGGPIPPRANLHFVVELVKIK
ncbi:MAG: FKBP-type peptidyl-prolyl cis-trans isomerase [Aureliella sp.]